MEHIPDDAAFINQIHRVLQPDGLLYMTVPAHQWLWSGHDVRAQHYRRYNRGTIRGLLGPNFELLYFTYFFGILIPATFLVKTLPFRLHIARSGSVLPMESEHGTEGGMSVGVLRAFLKNEYRQIARGQELHFGTSCMFVARKTDT